ncbi:MAG: SAM-dependent methyltransferase [bacterium]
MIVSWRSLRGIFRAPNIWAQYLIERDCNAFFRLHFLHAAHMTGVLKVLDPPATMPEIAHKLGVLNTSLHETFLSLGVSLKELSYDGAKYRVSGRRACSLLTEAGDANAAMIEEYVGYHNSVYRHLPERLAGAPPGDYLSGAGPMIARSSRVMEPFVAAFVESIVRGRGPIRLLEIGCGSGVYLRYAAKANAQLTGVAIDLDPEVVQQAVSNLERWGVAHRFKVMVADIRNPPPELAGVFDLITLYNNIYYFPEAERPALFHSLKDRLSPSGSLALVTTVQGASPIVLDFDLALKSTQGTTGLPTLDALKADFRAGGFLRVQATKLFPLLSFYRLIAHPS